MKAQERGRGASYHADYSTRTIEAAAAVAAAAAEPEPYWPPEREPEDPDDEGPYCSCDGSCPACRARGRVAGA